MVGERDHKAPIIYRFLRAVGRPFGLRWVGDNQVAVVYRLERYHTLKGPGFFWINRFTQSVRKIIDLAPDFIPVTASDIHTQDALQLDLAVALAYLFDPALMPPEKAALYVTWTRETHRAIITDNVKRALQAVVPSFYAEDICRGKAFAEIERQVMSELATRVKPLALKPLICLVLQVGVPPKLQDRFEAVVQRQVNIEDLGHYAPYEISQALRTEALEALRGMAGGRQYINMPDLTDMVAQPQGQLPPRRVVPGATVKGKESEEEPLPPPPPSKKTKSRL
jgi:regulator of protease activity HflC (stomatin/prohibitin superfamily)